MEGVLVDGDRVVITSKTDAQKLYRMGFYGKFVTFRKVKDFNVEDVLELSLFEALYLCEKGVLKVKTAEGKELTPEELRRICEQSYDNFCEAYEVYKDLRGRGYVVKSGLKFGAIFAVYEYGPGIDHAPFLVHVIPSNTKIDPIEIVRAGRLSHAVKKKFVLAYVENGKITYLAFKWFG